MDDREKSDGRVLPVKLPNNAQGGAAEAVEGRRPAKGNAIGETRSGPSAGQSALSELGRVRRVATKDKEARFTALLHHVDVDRLRAAYWALEPEAAPGVDGVTSGGLRAGSRGEPSGSARAGPQGCVPGETVAEGVHTKTRRAAAAARGRLAGGQGPAAGAGRGVERHLRGGLSWLLVRVSAWAQPASGVGCARGRDRGKEGELGARRGFPRLLLKP